MPYARWPLELPQRPDRGGYSRGVADGRLFLEMDKGPPKSRNEFSSAAVPITAPRIFDANQVARFERFWMVDTGRGVLPFWMFDPMLHGQRKLAQDGSPLLLQDGRFRLIEAWDLVSFGKEPPMTRSAGGNLYRIDFSLLRQPR